MHDPLSVADLVNDELLQRRESGYEVAGLEAALGTSTADDHGRLEARYHELIMTKRRSDWHYEEPALLEEIIAAMPSGNREWLAAAGRSYRTSHSWEQALERIRSRFGHYSWVHSINNACLITAGLLRGDGDFASTVGLTVQGGWDTDSNAATAGSVVGTVLGAAKLPPHFIKPLQDRTRSAVFGYDNSRLSDLARRTARLAEDGLRSDAGDHASSAA